MPNDLQSKLFVTFTMDCERIQEFSPPGGPETWDRSEQAISGFADVLSAQGLVGTFFIVPETAHQHRELFLSLEAKGFELGMHLHPHSFADLRHQEYLGGYDYEMQVSLLSQAAEVWAEGLGRRPTTFRPGNFSANDSTFLALYNVGFRQGSVSAPERVLPEYKAVWSGTAPYAHHAHPAFRLIAGDLDFYEVPVTENLTRRAWSGKSAMELRVEMAEIDVHRETIEQQVAAMVEGQIPVKTIVSITHNYFAYDTPGDKHRKILEGIALAVKQTAETHGLELCPVTLEDLHQLVDKTS